jgi:hypothetical protein
MNDGPTRDEKSIHVETYKTILREILDQRPSGTRQRLATALGKNRSFVSQISQPTYPAPVPAPHVEVIFEICHFSSVERRSFLDAFMKAHPNRLKQIRSGPSLRTLKLEVFDFGSSARNHEFDQLVREMARRMARLIRHED